MKISSNRLIKNEIYLRLFALLSLLAAAILLLTDNQTRLYFGVYQKKVNYKSTVIFQVSVYVYAIGAGYNLMQLVRCLAFTKGGGDKLSWSVHVLKWTHFLIDQMAAYVVFAIVCATIQVVAFFALVGVKNVEWMTLCNKYVRFCSQIGGSLLCGFVATIVMVMISSISTFNLFTLYSPNFLCLKPKKIGIVTTTN